MTEPFDPTTPLSRDVTTSHSGSRFREGDVLATRYRIVRVAGIGGMGVVYEAEDRELGERVALKTLHAGAGAEEREVARLRREVQLARRVTHPNVCRIYDAGRHEDIVFVTMEMLEGATLSEHISAHGRLDADAAGAILRQLAAGLQAAHDAGVIHRDFKSGNVMLVQRGSVTRAVITDFGLARQSGPTIDALASHGGRLVGTPAYMAPEQIKGAELTPSADVYALGVVAFEMIAGEVPFRDTSLPGLVRRLHEPPPRPRDFVAGVDARWEALILRCLEREPADRFASAADVARALDDDVPSVAPPRRRRWLPIAIAIAIVLLSIAAFVATRRHPPKAVAATVKPARRAVAILGFRNLSQRHDAEWLSTALAEMLATEHAAAESLRIIPGEEIARAKRDLAIETAESHSAPTLTKIRGATGADYIVLGSYVALPDRKLRLDLRVQPTAGGDAVSFGSAGSEDDLFALVARTGAELRSRLGADARLAEGLDLRRGVPLNTEAARQFAEGVARMRAFDVTTARDAFERAVAADPQFALAYGELSDAYAYLGYDERAAAAARRAVEISGGLPRSERLLLDAKYHQRSHRYKEAIDLYRSLVVQFPDDPDHRVRLINALIENSRGSEAMAEVGAMRKMRGAYDADPRVDLLEAQAADIVADPKRMLAAADRAVAKARAVQNRDVVAEALISRAWALAMTARAAEALAAFDEAEEIFAASGNRAGIAKSLRKRSFVYWRRGELDEAMRLNERALKMYRDVGQLNGAAASIGGIGVILNTQGDHTAARKQFTEALEIYRRIGDRQNVAWALSSIAGSHLMQNGVDAAIRGYEEALAISREVGDAEQQANTLGNLGIAYSTKGDLARSEARLTEALALSRKDGNRSMVASCESELGNLAFRRGELKKARAHHERAMKEHREIGERGGLADDQRALAQLDIVEGNPTTALAEATAAATEYEAEDRTSDRVRVLLHVARANFALGRIDEARAVLKTVRGLMREVQDPEVGLYLDIEQGRVDGDVAALARVVTRAEREKLIEATLDARLTLAETELRTGHRDRALARAATLAGDAESRGYLLIAERAKALR
jgi:tetratricopeptide (TPR) repeat protein/TolB-like protein